MNSTDTGLVATGLALEAVPGGQVIGAVLIAGGLIDNAMHPGQLSMNQINVNITKTGRDAIEQARSIVNDSSWQNYSGQARSTADNAGHKCGPGMHFNSLDSDTVHDLEQYTNANDHSAITDILLKESTNLNDSVFKPDGAFMVEFNKQVSLNQELHSKLNTMVAAQPGIIAAYKGTIAELTKRKDIIQKILNDAAGNNTFLNSMQNSEYLANLQNANTNFDNYLSDVIGVTQGITIQNYEDLYSTIILQNNILQSTVNEMNNTLLMNDRKANTSANNKGSANIIYVRILIVYIILLIIYAILLIFFNKEWSFYKKIIVVVLLSIFPVAAPYIEILFYNIFKYIIAIMSGSIFKYETVL
jgi:hypothetical protein